MLFRVCYCSRSGHSLRRSETLHRANNGLTHRTKAASLFPVAVVKLLVDLLLERDMVFIDQRALSNRVVMQATRLSAYGLWAIAVFGIVERPVQSQAITLEQLDGKRITFSVAYNTSGRNLHGEFSGAVSTTVGQIQISGNSVSGSATRTVTYHGKTVGSRTGALSGEIGKPQQGTLGGNYVWLLDGDSLILLRTLKVGGIKITITFTENGCSVRAPIMHEVGAGETTAHSVFGGDVVVHSATPQSSSCGVGG
jgi:hypothetical protein